MSFWNEDHPMQWMYRQVEKALPLFGPASSEDLTEAANLICLIYDFFNNGCLSANIEARLSRYKEECKYGRQMFKEYFEQVMYWYENDCMPTDEEQEWYATYWIECMLQSIDFKYDESKKPPSPKRESPKPSPKRKRESEIEARAKAGARLDRMYKVARAAEPAKRRRVVTKPYKCSKCGLQKKGHTCRKAPVEACNGVDGVKVH